MDIIKIFLQLALCVNYLKNVTANENYDEILYNAVISNSSTQVQQTLSEKNYTNINKYWYNGSLNATLLNIAVLMNNTKIATVLLNEGADPYNVDSHKNSALHNAVMNENFEIIHTIITKDKNGINYKNIKGESALHIVAKMNNAKLFNILLQAGGNPYEREQNNYTALHLAVQCRNILIIKEIINNPKGINFQNNNGRTALHLAAETNQTKIFELLLQHGGNPYAADLKRLTSLHEAVNVGNLYIVNLIILNNQSGVNIQDIYGATALHRTIKNNLRDAAEILLTHGADPSIMDQNGQTALHLTTFHDSFLEIVKLIINKNKNLINLKDTTGYTALHLATYYNNTQTVEFLLNESADPYIFTNKKTTPLHTAVGKNNINLVQIILNKTTKGINMQEMSGGTALFGAALINNYEMFKLLMKNGADPNIKHKSGMIPFHISAKFGNIQIAELILKEHKININLLNNRGYSALHIASHHNRPDMVQFLLDNNADQLLENYDGALPLHEAAEYGHLKVIQILLKSCTKCINKQNNKGLTVLYLSTYHNHTDAVEYLLSNGADEDTPTIKGNLPLHAAALNGNKRILQMLKKPIINVQTTDGYTVLHMACQGNAENAVDFLISLGANPNIVSYAGWTPLHLCAQYGSWSTAELILNVTKNTNAQNSYGYTAVMIALLNGQLETTKGLLRYGADPNIGDVTGQTLIHAAAKEGFIDILKTLISKNNTSIDFQDALGYTSLQWAINYVKLNIIEYLINNNANISIINRFGHNILHYIPRIRNISDVEFIFKEISNSNGKNIIFNLINQQDIFGFTPLSLAAEVANEYVFFFLLGKGADVNVIDSKGQSLLHRACIGGSVKIVKYLLDHTTQSKDSKAYNGLTPIMFAASNRANTLFKFLINNDTMFKSMTHYGVTIHHFAAMGGNVYNLLTIINRTIDLNVNIGDTEGYTPLMIAVNHNNIEASKFLMSNGADPMLRNSLDESSVTLAAKHSTLETLSLFEDFEYNADFMLGNALTSNRDAQSERVIRYLLQKSSIRKNLIFYAAATGNDTLLDLVTNNITFTKRFYFKNLRKQFPIIMKQFLKDYDESVKELLDDEDDIPSFNDYLTPLDVSLLFLGKLSTIKLLVEKLKINIKSECTMKKWTPLDFAIFRGDEYLLYLIFNSCGETISKITNNYGWTAIHKAVWAGNKRAFDILKKYGVDFEKRDAFNRTPLHIAAIRGNRYMVKALVLFAEKTVNSRDIHGFTPLHLTMIYSQGQFFSKLALSSSNLPAAVRYQFTSLGIDRDAFDYYASASTLMDKKADLNAQDKAFGWTPLHWAAINGEEWMANMLVSYGAKVNIPSWDEETPMKIARKWGRIAIYKYLKSKERNQEYHWLGEQEKTTSMLLNIQCRMEPTRHMLKNSFGESAVTMARNVLKCKQLPSTISIYGWKTKFSSNPCFV